MHRTYKGVSVVPAHSQAGRTALFPYTGLLKIPPFILNLQVPRPFLLLRGLSAGTFWKMSGKPFKGEVTRVYFIMSSSSKRMDTSWELSRTGLFFKQGWGTGEFSGKLGWCQLVDGGGGGLGTRTS